MQVHWRSVYCHSMCNSFCKERLLRVCVPVIDLHCVVSAGRCHNVFTAWAEVYGCDSTLYQPSSIRQKMQGKACLCQIWSVYANTSLTGLLLGCILKDSSRCLLSTSTYRKMLDTHYGDS